MCGTKNGMPKLLHTSVYQGGGPQLKYYYFGGSRPEMAENLCIRLQTDINGTISILSELQACKGPFGCIVLDTLLRVHLVTLYWILE